MDAGVPTCPVKHEDDLLAGAGAHLTGEGGQLHLKERNADGRSQMKDRAAGGGMHKAHQIAPRIAMLDGGEGTLPIKTPDFVQDRLEADAVFVGRPQLDLRVREGRGDCAQQGS